MGDIQYSREIGEEADSVSLTAKNIITVYYYKKQEMLKLLQEKIAGAINSGYKLTLDQINFQLVQVDKTIDLKLSAKAVKDVNKSAVTQAIVFKNQEELEQILKKSFSAESFILKIKEPLPVLNNYTSPFSENNAILLIGS